MPELPEVETVVRMIRPKLVGRKIIRCEFTIPRQLLPQTPKQLSAALRYQTVVAVTRRGKYIQIEVEKGTLLIHLRMTGRLYVRKAGQENNHERARLELDGGTEWLVLDDPRTLGTIRYFPAGKVIPELAEMGWEPLEDLVDVNELTEKLVRRSMAIKPVLLDQTVWAGIGNIYASEALWEARIDPRKSANALTKSELQRLIKAVPVILKRALEKGGSTLRNFADPEGKKGSYQKEFLVYGRDGEPCLHCGKSIVKFVQAQRSTYYCKSCQK
jgi:formamidopyrimidine-DNA glycosylase